MSFLRNTTSATPTNNMFISNEEEFISPGSPHHSTPTTDTNPSVTCYQEYNSQLEEDQLIDNSQNNNLRNSDTPASTPYVKIQNKLTDSTTTTPIKPSQKFLEEDDDDKWDTQMPTAIAEKSNEQKQRREQKNQSPKNDPNFDEDKNDESKHDASSGDNVFSEVQDNCDSPQSADYEETSL
eukprot:TRINITY_DN3097_c0_g1_i1.p1 TRINITY_DN3097_c0_g1~~TRINITY_DN3097_c0_g1_i1.p1  ORF type:complete len:181 (+),score=44.21 TRINITY_DN3097_c0_g1_i1:359-901(+)